MTESPASATDPPLSVHQFTTLGAAVDDDVASALHAGAQGLGLSEWKCGLSQIEPLADDLRLAGLGVSSYLPAHFSLLPFDMPLLPPQIRDPQARLAAQMASVGRASTVGAKLVVVVLGPGDSPHDRDAVRTALLELSVVAAEHGVAVGVEYLSRSRASILPDWKEFLHFVTELKRDNIGIVLDVQHVVDVPDIFLSPEAWASQLMLVQVSGVSERPRSPFDRLLPGDGQVAVVANFIDAVLEAGYRGWWEIEILSDDGRLGSALTDSLWRAPPPQLLPAAVLRTRALLRDSLRRRTTGR